MTMRPEYYTKGRENKPRGGGLPSSVYGSSVQWEKIREAPRYPSSSFRVLDSSSSSSNAPLEAESRQKSVVELAPTNTILYSELPFSLARQHLERYPFASQQQKNEGVKRYERSHPSVASSVTRSSWRCTTLPPQRSNPEYSTPTTPSDSISSPSSSSSSSTQVAPAVWTQADSERAYAVARQRKDPRLASDLKAIPYAGTFIPRMRQQQQQQQQQGEAKDGYRGVASIASLGGNILSSSGADTLSSSSSSSLSSTRPKPVVPAVNPRSSWYRVWNRGGDEADLSRSSSAAASTNTNTSTSTSTSANNPWVTSSQAAYSRDIFSSDTRQAASKQRPAGKVFKPEGPPLVDPVLRDSRYSVAVFHPSAEPLG